MKNKEKIRKVLPYVIIFIVTLIITIPLFSNDISITRDDGVQHVARLIEQYHSIKDGYFFGEIYQNLCNEFGYSWNLFYSPLTAILPMIFKVFTDSFFLILKLFMTLMLFLSGLTMYWFLNKMTKNTNISLLGAIIYILAPYHLTDMYTRVALAEFTSFVFLPLVFLGLHEIFYDKKKGCTLILGAVGLVLTHTVITVVTAIFSLIYILVHYRELKQINIIKKLIICSTIILLITSFFTIPLLEHKQNAEYEVFQEERMATMESYENSKIDISKLFFTDNPNLIFEIGIVTFVGLLLTPIAWKKIGKNQKKEYLIFLILGLLCICFSLKIFPINPLGKFSTFLQFAWRFLEFSSFFLSVIAAINIGNSIINFKERDVWILVLVILLSLVPLKNCIDKRDNLPEEILLNTVKVTEKTGTVHAGCAKFEYLPTKAFQNRDYIEKREDKIYQIEGKAQISEYYKDGLALNCHIKTDNETAKLELPYIYYLGYTAELDTGGQIEELPLYETEKGFVGISIPANSEGILQISYTGTNIMIITKIISLLGVILFIAYATINGKKNLQDN